MAFRRVPAARWKRLPLELRDRLQEHTLTVLAAGIAFYAFLALVPALVVLVSVYGLFADPADIEQQVEELGGALPDEARIFVVAQLRAITSTSGSSLTAAALVSTLVALWSASAGIATLMKSVAVAFGTTDTRNYAVKRGLAVVMTLGALVFVALSIAVIAVLPAWLAGTGLATEQRVVLNAVRLPVVGLVMMVGLGLLYHVSRPDPPDRIELFSWGTLAATGLWMVSSLAFSWYTADFGNYNETYGSLGIIIVVLLWLWLSALVVLLGAEIDSELGP